MALQLAGLGEVLTTAYRKNFISLRNVELMGERSGVYRVLMGKPERNRPAGRPRRRWEDNIKMDIPEVVV